MNFQSDMLNSTDIIPLLRTDPPAAAALELIPPGERPICEPFVANLLVCYAIENEVGYQFISEIHCESLGIASHQLRQLAVANLRRRYLNYRINEHNPVYMVVGMENHEASLLLVDDFWEPGGMASQYVAGEIVVAIPARELLFFTALSSAQGIDVLQQVIKKAMTEETDGYTLSDYLLLRRAGRWQEYSLTDTPLRREDSLGT